MVQNYIPYENYELELLVDKFREFCKLAQSLGAKELTIESINSSTNDSGSQQKQNGSVELEYKDKSGSLGVSTGSSNHLIDDISKSISLHQEFSPKGLPLLPDDLVWYEGEPSWKDLYKQRMHGSLIHHEKRIETKKSRAYAAQWRRYGAMGV